MNHFPYELRRGDADLVVMALRSYLSRQTSGDGASNGMEILRDELELCLEESKAALFGARP